MPSEKRGMRARPSARTSDMMTPAPRDSGVAMNLSSTWPSLTRTNSSSPIGESSLRVHRRADRRRAVGGLARAGGSISGLRNSSLVRMAETG